VTNIRDTSVDYEDLVGYKAKETTPTGLSSFLGEQEEHKLYIKPKPIDPEFPEDWQNLYVNFSCEGELIEFMKAIGQPIGPKTSVLVFSKDRDDGILGFMGD
jgi:hypothetical protein